MAIELLKPLFHDAASLNDDEGGGPRSVTNFTTQGTEKCQNCQDFAAKLDIGFPHVVLNRRMLRHTLFRDKVLRLGHVARNVQQLPGRTLTSDGKYVKHSKDSDVWAFGMVVYVCIPLRLCLERRILTPYIFAIVVCAGNSDQRCAICSS